MTERNSPPDRDEVLVAFHERFGRPTAEDINAWIDRYPQFAEDIRAHAIVLRDWDAQGDGVGEEVTSSELADAYSRALNVFYNVEVQEGTSPSTSAAEDFVAIMARATTTIAKTTTTLGHGMVRSVVGDLVQGRMEGPVRRRFRSALYAAWSITTERFDRALEISLRAPQMGLAKAKGSAGANVRPYDDIIRSSGMAPEDIKYWLEED